MIGVLAAGAVAHDLLVLFLIVLLAVVLIGAVHWVASQILPHPWPNVVTGLLGLILVVWVLLALIDAAE